MDDQRGFVSLQPEASSLVGPDGQFALVRPAVGPPHLRQLNRFVGTGGGFVLVKRELFPIDLPVQDGPVEELLTLGVLQLAGQQDAVAQRAGDHRRLPQGELGHGSRKTTTAS